MSTNTPLVASDYNRVDSLLIPHAAFSRTIERIEQCFKAMSHANDPLGIAILGESRTGKSRVLEHFEMMHAPQRTPAGLRVPFLRARIPSKPSVKGLATLLLHALRDPKFDSGTEVAKTLRLQSLIRQVGTVVLALDEFQHFEDKATHRIQHEVADWLKVLVDETHIGLVVTGLPSGMAVIRQNEQLAGRFAAPAYMPRFDWKEPADVEQFQGILGALQAALDTFELPDMAADEMSFRLYCASGGLIGYVIKILKQATWNALDRGTHMVRLEDFASAYREAVITEELAQITMPNPFTNEFMKEDADILIAQAQNIGVKIEPPPKPRRGKTGDNQPRLGEVLSAR